METYYHPHDLGKFSEMGKGNKDLWEKFMAYYGAVFTEGACTPSFTIHNSSFNIVLRSCVAGRFGISLREHLRKPRPDDAGHLGHEVGHLLPFLRQKILFQLRMNRPLGIDLCSFSAHEHPKQFHIFGARFGP